MIMARNWKNDLKTFKKQKNAYNYIKKSYEMTRTNDIQMYLFDCYSHKLVDD